MSESVSESAPVHPLQQYVEEYFSGYEYGHISPISSDAQHMLFQSDTYPIQFELISRNGVDALQYKISKVADNEPHRVIANNTKYFTQPTTPELTQSRLRVILNAVSDNITGAVLRGEVRPHDEMN